MPIMTWSLPAFALKRPVTMAMAVVTLMCIGGIAWYLTPVQFAPRVSVPIVVVNIPYPGANPQQVENEVAVPAEGEFKKVRGLDNIHVHSWENYCSIRMYFSWATDMTLAVGEIRDHIERLKLQWPAVIDQVRIQRYYSDMEPIMRFCLLRDRDQDELALAARTTLRSQLLRIDGVAEVTVSGNPDEKVYVDFDQDALHSLNLSIQQVMSALNGSSVNLNAGLLDDGGQRHFVRTRDELTSPEELEQLVVAPGGTKLRDVARIRHYGPQGAEGFTLDGKRGVLITLRKEAEANTVNTCKQVHAALERLKDDPVFRGADWFVFEDQGEIVTFALSTVVKAGKYGSLMAFLFLLLALRRLRPTLIVALMTPASLVAAFAFLYFNGQSLNLVTLAGMLISVGMLVDNAIVVVENIERHRLLGRSPVESALRGTKEVSMAVTASTMTTCIVFIPIIYMQRGEFSLYMGELAGPMATALFASLFLAMTVLPLAESRTKPEGNRRWDRLKQRLLSNSLLRLPAVPLRLLAALHPIQWAKVSYRDLLDLTIRRRAISLALLAALLLVTYLVPGRSVGMKPVPTMNLNQVGVNFHTDPGFGGTERAEALKLIEGVFENHRERLCIKNLYINGGQFRAYLARPEDLPPGQELPFDSEEVRDILREMLPYRVPGGRIVCGVINSMGMEEAPEPKGFSGAPAKTQTVSIEMRGDDYETLLDLAEKFKFQVESLPDMLFASSARDAKEDEIRLEVDEVQAALAGAAPSAVASAVHFALSGTRLPYLKRDGKEVTVWGQYEGQDRRTMGNLENVQIKGAFGRQVPLSQLVTMGKGPAARSLYRSNGKVSTTVSGKTATENLSKVSASMKKLAAEFETPPGYSFTLGLKMQQLDENLKDFIAGLVLSLILIYLLMSALFESPFYPLSILTTVAMAFVGVFWIMYLTGTPIDAIALVCMLLMCGIIVNNGIVIVDHINQLRKEGMTRHDAIVQAGCDRFRPVLMTSLTTILGSLPLAIAPGETASALHSTGRAFVGGLTAGTALTLLAVPLAYTYIDDLQDWMRQFFAGLLRLAGRPASSETAP